MAVHKKCLSCDYYRDSCTGEEKACGEWKEIDLNPTPEEPVERIPTTVMPPGQCEGTDGAEESRMDKFARIGNGRQKKVLEGLRVMEHLTKGYLRKKDGVKVYNYEWTPDMVKELIGPIEEAVEALKADLLVCEPEREYGLIEEKSHAVPRK